jgi:hypothetical protein
MTGRSPHGPLGAGSAPLSNLGTVVPEEDAIACVLRSELRCAGLLPRALRHRKDDPGRRPPIGVSTAPCPA